MKDVEVMVMEPSLGKRSSSFRSSKMCLCNMKNMRFKRRAKRRLIKNYSYFKNNNILSTPDFEGVGYAPSFDHLIVFGRDQIKSQNMEEVIVWCGEKVVNCWCKLKDYWNVSHYKKQVEESKKQVEESKKQVEESKKWIEESKKQVEELEKKLKKAEEQAATAISLSNLSPPPPPPLVPQLAPSLPPPPPPPPPMVKTPTSTKLMIVKRKSDTQTVNESQNSLFVTPEALQGIRLRKANDRIPSIKDPNTRGLVTLDALKSVSLRRTQSAKSLDDVGKENLHQMLAHDLLNRRALRKTTIRRSPGGTPLSDKKRKRESGQGLTPVMTRALKRKFRLAKRESLSSDDGGFSNTSSPDMSFCNQTINTSSGNLSWGSSPNDSPTCISSFTQDKSSPLSDLSTNIMESSSKTSVSSSNVSASSPNLVF